MDQVTQQQIVALLQQLITTVTETDTQIIISVNGESVTFQKNANGTSAGNRQVRF